MAHYPYKSKTPRGDSIAPVAVAVFLFYFLFGYPLSQGWAEWAQWLFTIGFFLFLGTVIASQVGLFDKEFKLPKRSKPSKRQARKTMRQVRIERKIEFMVDSAMKGQDG